MDNTDNIQDVPTPDTINNGGLNVDTPSIEKKVDNLEPYKSFTTKEEFDKHSLGILNSAKSKVEKELLGVLGLKPDEKDKLIKFKEVYEASLTEAEKQAKNLENLNTELNTLRNSVSEKEAIILALSQISGKNEDDVSKYIKMAKGLVDDNTSMSEALTEVMKFVTIENKPSIPIGKRLVEPNNSPIESNPFLSDNLTEQGKLMKSDIVKAREMYKSAHGKLPNW